jgi:predicted nucleic acid-binding Zn ribbon protein
VVKYRFEEDPPLSEKKEKKARIVDHRHCRICGRAIPPDKEICSEECMQVQARIEARQRRMRNIMLIMYAVIFLIFFILLFLGGRPSH